MPVRFQTSPAEGEGVEPPSLAGRSDSSGVPSPIGLTLPIALCGRLTSDIWHLTSPLQSGRQESNLHARTFSRTTFRGVMCLPISPLPVITDISRPERFSLRVTVRAREPQIVGAVVPPIPVDMVHLQDQGLPVPEWFAVTTYYKTCARPISSNDLRSFSVSTGGLSLDLTTNHSSAVLRRKPPRCR